MTLDKIDQFPGDERITLFKLKESFGMHLF